MDADSFKPLLPGQPLLPGDSVVLNVVKTKWKDEPRKSKKELLLENVAELDQFADQLMMLEEYEDRLNGSNIKESLEAIRNIIEESVL